MQKGRSAAPLRPGQRDPKRATVPTGNLTLRDGRELLYQGLGPPAPVGGGVTIRMAAWSSDDGMRVLASMDRTPHGRLLHLSLSYPDHLPTWEDITAVRDAFYPRDVDAAMLLPRSEDYVNLHSYCMHLWQVPVVWGLQ